jgi:hypothetical protein
MAMAQEMWSSVRSVVDWHSLFDSQQGRAAEVGAKLLKKRKMLLTEYIFACNQVYVSLQQRGDAGGRG